MILTEYVKSTNFASKDSLAIGNPLKIVKGTEIDAEFNNIAVAVATKADLNSPALVGVPTAPTAAPGTNTVQVATAAFVTAATVAERTATVTLTNKTLVTPKVDVINENTSAAGVTVDGVLLKDGNVTGSLTGNVTGNVTGDVTGNLTGNVTGNVTGSSGTVTTITTDQVLAAIAGASLGAVGTYAWLGTATSTTITAGSTWAGSDLRYAGTLSVSSYSDDTAAAISSTAPSGTWMAMGSANNATRRATTMFLRIS
jgi:hypothetical protein